MTRYRPTAADLDALAAAWKAYLDDEPDGHDRLAVAIGNVLGRRPSAARRALESASAVNILDLPTEQRDFTGPSDHPRESDRE